MKKWMGVLFLVAAVLTLGPPAQADRKAYVFDKNHSEINFIAEARFLSAHGFFGSWDGQVEVDPAKLDNSTLTITIDTASINTRNQTRDGHLKTADFFDAATFPKITFTSSRITQVDAQNLLIDGTLTMRGVTKPLQVPVRVVFLEEGHGRFKGEFKLNRKDFGINYNSRLNPIEDIVAVQFDFHLMDKKMMEENQRQMQQRQPQPPAPKPPVK